MRMTRAEFQNYLDARAGHAIYLDPGLYEGPVEVPPQTSVIGIPGRTVIWGTGINDCPVMHFMPSSSERLNENLICSGLVIAADSKRVVPALRLSHWRYGRLSDIVVLSRSDGVILDGWHGSVAERIVCWSHNAWLYLTHDLKLPRVPGAKHTQTGIRLRSGDDLDAPWPAMYASFRDCVINGSSEESEYPAVEMERGKSGGHLNQISWEGGWIQRTKTAFRIKDASSRPHHFAFRSVGCEQITNFIDADGIDFVTIDSCTLQGPGRHWPALKVPACQRLTIRDTSAVGLIDFSNNHHASANLVAANSNVEGLASGSPDELYAYMILGYSIDGAHGIWKRP
ncbi:hypothetical protein Noc_1883 [Nitrosococcus oceani ATCC 19707]|uniref:Uncharacterized protein n=2 Tax=Nitrosococcus oceani TaxID=1229 RepID=Q3J9Z7_NITOC|nr:hypothetical protein [Nitrosococcus oceani]ABA58349.1 hypothetical protein Noc_1883 [Nitrosococcus oceani ATCC 19707]EDZ67520.1 hypothetical protein NOC27_847 [Nitrosococcus oceani AFC27]KFI19279.1 hypothetical protein IB75_10035 [Nitrosococcus oceani C-27]GEM18738.1 hypothetical protein NONS58_00950 [Nitrosococcus oceani]